MNLLVNARFGWANGRFDTTNWVLVGPLVARQPTHVGILVVELEHLPELRRVDGLHESVGGCAGGLAGERESNEESGREGGRAGGRW